MGYVHACTVTIFVNTVNQTKEKVPVLGEEGMVTAVVVGEEGEGGAEANNAWPEGVEQGRFFPNH